MREILLVANQSLGGDQLAEIIRTRVAQEPTRFSLVVPATPAPLEVAATIGATAGAGIFGPPAVHGGYDAAARRLATGLAWLRELGATVDGDVGDEDPLHAIDETVARKRFDEIIISTLPTGLSRWLHQDLPHRAERRFHLPVTVVTAT